MATPRRTPYSLEELRAAAYSEYAVNDYHGRLMQWATQRIMELEQQVARLQGGVENAVVTQADHVDPSER